MPSLPRARARGCRGLGCGAHRCRVSEGDDGGEASATAASPEGPAPARRPRGGRRAAPAAGAPGRGSRGSPPGPTLSSTRPCPRSAGAPARHRERRGRVPLRVLVPRTPSRGPRPSGSTCTAGGVAGSAELNDRFQRRVAADVGCAVVAVDYRLAPEHPFREASRTATTRWSGSSHTVTKSVWMLDDWRSVATARAGTSRPLLVCSPESVGVRESSTRPCCIPRSTRRSPSRRSRRTGTATCSAVGSSSASSRPTCRVRGPPPSARLPLHALTSRGSPAPSWSPRASIHCGTRATATRPGCGRPACRSPTGGTREWCTGSP
ncbi:hypothetical protein ER308_21210 [Egibacter rhizosphaerae]|uniref:Alpha/beta hydrolase fold-3 domain-containing protein n=1 Tax=Egibacter rhizosphaerae TaxID=1670831 RepID=A0A411YLW7_9ACTN|nr:hypothetical protein ER308_21210 [Egibacter rhizosphaerae]